MRAALLLTLFLWAVPAHAGDVERLTAYFETLVFGSEFSPELAAKMVAKWQGPIGVSIQGRVKKRHAQWASFHLTTLKKLTGLTFRQIPKGKPGANFYLLFLRGNEMAKAPIPRAPPGLLKKLAASRGCYFLMGKKPPSRILWAFIVVNVERDDRAINACLLEEMAQSLGLPNDSNRNRPSIFSDKDRLTLLAPDDELMLRTLYDPRMKAGFSPEEARKAAREIIGELAR